MSLTRQKLRDIVLQLLFSAGFEASSDLEMVPFMMNRLAISRKKILEAQMQKERIVEKLGEIDLLLRNTITEYDLERIPRLELTILRLGAYELLYTDLPPKVAIAEALRLAHKYATSEAASFVNAVLDAIYKNKHAIC